MHSVTRHGEADRVDQSAFKKGIVVMKSVLLAFDLDAIYNIDRSGLFTYLFCVNQTF